MEKEISLNELFMCLHIIFVCCREHILPETGGGTNKRRPGYIRTVEHDE